MYLISVLGCTKTFFDGKIKEYHLRSLIDTKSSLPEKILGDYLTEIGVKWEKSKQIIKPLEIDFFIPSLKIGFEYNGNYWHNKNKKGEGYHLRKTELGLKKGVQIFHIFEYEWLENPEGIKEYIRLLTTEEGERNLKDFLDEKCSSTLEIVSDVSKESDDWYISRGFECSSVIPPTPLKINADGFKCREGEKEFCVVYNCGYKTWKRR